MNYSIIAYVSNPYPFFLVFYEMEPESTKNYWKVSCISKTHKIYMETEYESDPSFEPFSYNPYDCDMSFPCFVAAAEAFKALIKAYEIKSVNVSNSYLKWVEDCAKSLENEEPDPEAEKYDAYLLYQFENDRSLLDRLERKMENDDTL